MGNSECATPLCRAVRAVVLCNTPSHNFKSVSVNGRVIPPHHNHKVTIHSFYYSWLLGARVTVSLYGFLAIELRPTVVPNLWVIGAELSDKLNFLG